MLQVAGDGASELESACSTQLTITEGTGVLSVNAYVEAFWGSAAGLGVNPDATQAAPRYSLRVDRTNPPNHHLRGDLSVGEWAPLAGRLPEAIGHWPGAPVS